VVDEQNRPVAGAILCPQWGMGPDGRLAPLGPSATTGASGEFSLENTPGFTEYHGRIALLAFGPSRNLGAFVDTDERGWTQRRVIRLLPVHQVRYAASFENAHREGPITVQFYSQADMLPIPSLPGSSGTIDLPPGRYELHASAPDADPAKEQFVLGNSNVELPPLRLELSPVARHFGRGTPRLTALTDLERRSLDIDPLRGHWTYLYFWADWCVPCIAKGIPKINTFVLSHRDKQSQFRVIGIRFNNADEAGDWNDFRAKTLKLEKSVWHFIPAFPLAYDETTRMTADWGIHGVPAAALIDPEGNLVRNGSLEVLAKALDRASNATGK